MFMLLLPQYSESTKLFSDMKRQLEFLLQIGNPEVIIHIGHPGDEHERSIFGAVVTDYDGQTLTLEPAPHHDSGFVDLTTSPDLDQGLGHYTMMAKLLAKTGELEGFVTDPAFQEHRAESSKVDLDSLTSLYLVGVTPPPNLPFSGSRVNIQQIPPISLDMEVLGNLRYRPTPFALQ